MGLVLPCAAASEAGMTPAARIINERGRHDKRPAPPPRPARPSRSGGPRPPYGGTVWRGLQRRARVSGTAVLYESWLVWLHRVE